MSMAKFYQRAWPNSTNCTPPPPGVIEKLRLFSLDWVETTKESSKFFGVFSLFLIDFYKPVLCYR